MPLPVMEVATDDNFDAACYLAANPDVRLAIQQDPAFSAWLHFDRFGRQEPRRQLNHQLARSMRQKYQRFSSLLDAADYRFAGAADSFPIVAATPHLNVADYQTESAAPSPSAWTSTLAGHPDGCFLDLGCGLRDVVYENCLYLEVYPSLTADIVMTPNTRLPLRDACLDGVGCFAVLEHVDDPFYVAAEITRVVRPGGRIFIDWPFLQPLHDFPSHFYNATAFGLQRAFEPAFDIEQLDCLGYEGPDHTLDWLLRWFADGIGDATIRQQLLSMSVADLLGHTPEDAFYRRCVTSMSAQTRRRLACGNSLIGRRRGPSPDSTDAGNGGAVAAAGR